MKYDIENILYILLIPFSLHTPWLHIHRVSTAPLSKLHKNPELDTCIVCYRVYVMMRLF